MQEAEFKFARVVFFGRGIQEYVNMFDLDLEALKGKKVLDCAAGPAAFARQARDYAIEVTACDPMYVNDGASLRATVEEDAAAVTVRQKSNKHLLYPDVVPTLERQKFMELFLADFPDGKRTGRYVAGQLPNLPFESRSFDLVLSANLLFIYSSTESGGMMKGSPFDYEFHASAARELLRVTKNEVRIYPLQGPGAKGHTYLPLIITECRQAGYEAEVLPVPQHDIIGAERMLVLRRT